MSAHLLIKDPKKLFGDLTPANYEDELLSMAHDLASRLLPAFQNSSTGIPAPRVSISNCTYGMCVLVLVPMSEMGYWFMYMYMCG